MDETKDKARDPSAVEEVGEGASPPDASATETATGSEEEPAASAESPVDSDAECEAAGVRGVVVDAGQEAAGVENDCDLTDVNDCDVTDVEDEVAPVSDDEPALTPESIVEALLFSTDVPLSGGRMAQILAIGTAGDVKRHIETLNKRYQHSGSVFRIEEIAGGFRMLTLPEFHPWVTKLQRSRAESRLSQAALETLAIVAYKQPVLRADIEAIRGVAVGDMLARLRETKLVKIVGRAEEVGRPLLYGTTGRFLEVFGLSSLKELPKLDQEVEQGVPVLKVVEPTPPPDG